MTNHKSVLNILSFAQATTCCAEVRGLLGCGPNPEPCRGFSGDCGDLQTQFTGVQDALPADYVCHQARERPLLLPTPSALAQCISACARATQLSVAEL